MHNIPNDLFKQIQENICRPEGTVTFNYSSPDLFNTEIEGGIILEVPSGQHVFRLERDAALNLHYFHSSPGTDTRVASIDLKELTPSESIFIAFTWSTKEINLYIKPKQGEVDGLISAKGIPSAKKLKVDKYGNIHEIGDIGLDVSGVHIFHGNDSVLQPSAIEAWRETISAIDILATGESTEGFMYESIVTNLTLSILVTGFEAYTKRRFLELEEEGISTNIKKLINSFYPKREREAGIFDILNEEALEKDISTLQYIIKRDNINFQSFKKCKEAYKQGYNIKFGELGLSGEHLNNLQQFIGYRHKIIHISASLGILNQDRLAKEQPIFPSKETRNLAKEHFKEFIEKLHQKTLTLQRQD
jgi:hypothetical protein